MADSSNTSPSPAGSSSVSRTTPSFGPFIPADETFQPTPAPRSGRGRGWKWHAGTPLSTTDFEPLPVELTPEQRAALANVPRIFPDSDSTFAPLPYKRRAAAPLPKRDRGPAVIPATMTRPAIRAVLIDLSGTLHVGAKPTDGAARALQRLRDARVPFRFCSNTSKEATSVLKEKLAGMGLGPRDGELWTSVGAVKDVLRVKGVKRPYIIASDSAKEECQGGVTEDPGVPYDAVVIAFAPAQFDYAALNTAFRVLMHEQTPRPDLKPATPSTIPFITTHRSRYVEDHDSALSLGPGPFVTALEHATGRTAEVVGKPTRAFFEMVQASLQPSTSAAARVVIIGDDVQSDLGQGAQELGLWRVLVRTGKYRPGDERREGVLPPDEVFDSFAAFVDSLLS